MAAQAACIPTTSDHLLLALCQRADVLGKEIDRITTNEAEESYADEQTGPLYEELGPIQRAIVDLSAHTLSGVIAKARLRRLVSRRRPVDRNGRSRDGL